MSSELGYLRSPSPRPSLARIDSSQSVASSVHSARSYQSDRTLCPAYGEWAPTRPSTPQATTILSDVWVPPDISARLQSPSLPPRMEQLSIAEAPPSHEEIETVPRWKRVCGLLVPVVGGTMGVGFVVGIIYGMVLKFKQD